ncbi:MAG: aryl-sulfate sulfotransferase [Bacteroidetes bacterium]|nr:aryl-sulfate sulfotransferase [Bacteroidota bacterium]
MFSNFSFAQSVTIGLLYQDVTNQPGTILFAPNANNTTYLINKCGYYLHSWTSAYKPGLSSYLLEDGLLLRPGNTNNPTFSGGGGAGGIIEKIDWSGSVVWSYLISDSTMCQHHDIHPLPNGNVLALVWEKKTKADAILAGRDTNFIGTTFWNEKIVELQPLGTTGANIVWEWNSWDHLIQDFDSTKSNFGIINQNPGLININTNFSSSSNPDWLHFNSIDYNASLDQILISSRLTSEIYIIDHSTTTLEAASHAGGNCGKGGDFIYRWGNPIVYNRGAVSDQKFFGQHSANWILQGLAGEGDIMVFNNGKDRPAGNYSTVEIIKTPVDTFGNYMGSATLSFLPLDSYWIYQDSIPTDLYSDKISGAQRIANGHTLICNGNKGEFIEIDSLNNIVWEYKNPVNGLGPRPQGTSIFNNGVFRTVFYNYDYPAFGGHTLTPGPPIELSPISYSCLVTSSSDMSTDGDSPIVYPNPFEKEITVSLNTDAEYRVFDLAGKLIDSGEIALTSKNINLDRIAPGMYLLQVVISTKEYFYKIVKLDY